MCEVKVSRRVCRPRVIALDYFANGYSHSRVMKRWRAVIDVGSIGSKRRCCESSKNEKLKHFETTLRRRTTLPAAQEKLEANGKG
jgi:hypothetical protein